MFKRFIACLLVFSMMPVVAFAHNFTDVSGHWAESEIEYAVSNNMVNGYKDNTFKPNNTVSRAEFLKMLIASLCENLDGDPEGHGDGKHWASKYYNFGVESGTIVPNDQVVFDGVSPAVLEGENYDYPIKRWEMAYLLYCCLRTVFGFDDEPATFNDVEATVANYGEDMEIIVGVCIKSGLIKGDNFGNFNPAKNGTRAEAVTIINRLDRYTKNVLAEIEAEEMKDVKLYDVIPEGKPQVEFTMENGKQFTVELYPEYAPQTVANFVELVGKGFYDGLTFHRIIKDFVVQGGDPNGDGTGDAGYKIIGEFADNGFAQNTLLHKKGVISMAKGEMSNSASCQFFICLDDAPHLDGSYAAFGSVIKGMENVEALAEVEVELTAWGEASTPKKEIRIKSAKIVK